ncbi:Eukaryotic aspartyl protease family protein [Striga hermonthica]|uniref:Eukaryotic aspartyl protease family protein n=1 Tax=Striga hermonthica TaxID=68872 RepID=A0A9N7MXR0_STRHE|nr:Eukaryotic aspartyl protease family protein [Striga hermonthica]
MTCSSQCYLSLFLFLLTLFFTLSSSHSTTLPLFTPTKRATTNTQWQQLRQMAIGRSANISSSTTPLFSNLDGQYIFTLSLGTPTQSLVLSLCTGCVLVSFPCGYNFSCVNCFIDPKDLLTFKPNQSSTSSPVYCDDQLLHKTISSDFIPVCTKCSSNNSCFNTLAEYTHPLEGSAGYILSESLTLPELNHPEPNLLFGCASKSDGWPLGIGIAGFGRAPSSLPSQLNLTKFSHCFVSKTLHDGDRNVSGSLVFTWGEDNEKEDEDCNGNCYTPLIKITNGTWRDSKYFVNVEEIMVGGVKVEVPTEDLTTTEYGNGGLKVEPGIEATLMDKSVFEPLAKELEKQVGKKYSRDTYAENDSMYWPCFYTGESGMNGMPEMAFRFQEGLELVVPVENLFWTYNESVICIAIWSQTLKGYSILLGQWMMQNVYVDYDLANNRLGFMPKNCTQVSN